MHRVPIQFVDSACALLVVFGFASSGAAQTSKWVSTGVTGRLIYVPDAEGDRILDFSNVGYKGRGSELLPNDVPTVRTVSPIAGDDTANIQAALNAVSAMPLQSNGYRGAVLLTAGDYDVATQLNINASGIVLRGVGRETTDTVLHARGTTQRSLIQVNGTGSQSLTGSVYSMIDKIVPAGANSFRLTTTAGLAVGQTVRVSRPGTQNWVNAIGMNDPPGDGPAWAPSEFNLNSDRIITRIEGNRVFVDAPLATSFTTQFGGGTLQRYTWAGRIQNVGIENMRAESDFNSAETSGSDLIDEDHAWTFVSTDKSQNVWFRNSLAKYFGYAAALANDESKWFTVDNVISQEPVSIVTGSRRYSFDLDGQMGFVTNSQSDKGRHNFVNNGAAATTGPNVFRNSIATNARDDAGPHRRWSTGTLFDNISVQGNRINARNRGDFGTSHGWSGANMVVWNSTAGGYYVQNPPTSQNWLVGSIGPIQNDMTFGSQPPGNYDSPGTKVVVGGEQSLYDAQSNDSANIRAFHWTTDSGNGNWNDQLAWREKVKPGVYAVHLRDYMLGDIDSFTNDGPGSPDIPFVDPAWQSVVLGSSSNPIAGFDDPNFNRNVAFTVQHQVDAGERVVHGFLALSVKATSSDVSTDFVRLFDSDANHLLTFSSLGWSSQISTTTPYVGVIDMGQYLDQLQAGAINVQVNDDTAVDWAIYTAAVATPIADPTGPAVFLDGGSVRVDSTISPVASLTNGSETAASLTIAAAGSLSVNDDYLQAANSTLKIEIAGPSAGQFGTITVGDDAILSGPRLELVNGYTPAAGTAFQIVSAQDLLGSSFVTASLPALDSSLRWQVDYKPDAVLVRVLFAFLAADFNSDGLVDDTDLEQWRLGVGTASGATRMQGDANVDGAVDGADFLIWQQQLGSGGIEALTLPEPAALAMLLAIAAAILCRLRTVR